MLPIPRDLTGDDNPPGKRFCKTECAVAGNMRLITRVRRDQLGIISERPLRGPTDCGGHLSISSSRQRARCRIPSWNARSVDSIRPALNLSSITSGLNAKNNCSHRTSGMSLRITEGNVRGRMMANEQRRSSWESHDHRPRILERLHWLNHPLKIPRSARLADVRAGRREHVPASESFLAVIGLWVSSSGREWQVFLVARRMAKGIGGPSRALRRKQSVGRPAFCSETR